MGSIKMTFTGSKAITEIDNVNELDVLRGIAILSRSAFRHDIPLDAIAGAVAMGTNEARYRECVEVMPLEPVGDGAYISSELADMLRGNNGTDT